MAQKVGTDLDNFAVDGAQNKTVQKKAYESIEDMQSDPTIVPLQYVPIFWSLLIFGLHDRNFLTSAFFHLKPRQFEKMANRGLIDEIVLPLLSSLWDQP